MNSDFVKELRDCAEELTKVASAEETTEKTASVGSHAVDTGRAEYMHSVMVALGLEE